MKISYLLSVVIAGIIIVSAGVIYLVYNPLESDVVDSDIPSSNNDLVPLGNMSFEDAVNAFGFSIFNEFHI